MEIRRVWMGKSDLTDEHQVRTDEGVVYAHRSSEENLRAVVETPQKPKTTTADTHLQLNLSLFLMHQDERHLKGVPSAKCLVEVNTFAQYVNVYTDSDWEGQHQTCKSTSGGVTQWRKCDSVCMFKNTTVRELEFCRSRIIGT